LAVKSISLLRLLTSFLSLEKDEKIALLLRLAVSTIKRGFILFHE
jgi:hypothetical protein